MLAGLLLEFIRGDFFGGFKHLPPIIIIGISYHLCNLLHGIVRVHRQHIYTKNVNTVAERNRRKGIRFSHSVKNGFLYVSDGGQAGGAHDRRSRSGRGTQEFSRFSWHASQQISDA